MSTRFQNISRSPIASGPGPNFGEVRLPMNFIINFKSSQTVIQKNGTFCVGCGKLLTHYVSLGNNKCELCLDAVCQKCSIKFNRKCKKCDKHIILVCDKCDKKTGGNLHELCISCQSSTSSQSSTICTRCTGLLPNDKDSIQWCGMCLDELCQKCAEKFDRKCKKCDKHMAFICNSCFSKIEISDLCHQCI